ncbi:DNA-directed RNA polymerase subunit alpha [Candidatus Palauibacter sp.]|uniref:DNA-directed RNA polymerase subunit alpha n=1 Tax=Candidatus Palauibacter sp. TaxID=3101350 RepID=UPI003B5CF625
MTVSVNLAGLVLPEAMEEQKRSEEGTHASFLLQPLERGFGHTIGNSIRRIMLSSLPGAAVWAFRADGVQHEHQTVDGVAEDVHQIIQNLKRLVLVMDEGEDEAKLSLSAHKAGPVTASRIRQHASIRVVNPDLLLFTLQEDLPENRPLTLDLWVNRGRGFVMAEQHEHPDESDERCDFPVGTIRIDSVYNPVTRANFSVRETRVGQRTDFDRLEVDVETNGALNPAEAVSQAAEIARLHLSYFSQVGSVPTLGDEADPAADENGGEPVDSDLAELLDRPLDEFSEISARSRNTLERQNISTLGDVVARSRDEILRLDNFGEKSLEEIAEVLGQHGLRFGMSFARDDDGNLYRLDDLAENGARSDDEA